MPLMVETIAGKQHSDMWSIVFKQNRHFIQQNLPYGFYVYFLPNTKKNS